MITTSQGILAYTQVQIYLELYDLVDGMTEKLVDVVGFRRACIHCQGENAPTHWIGYETGEAAHTAYRVAIWAEPVEVELDMNSRVLSIISSSAARYTIMST